MIKEIERVLRECEAKGNGGIDIQYTAKQIDALYTPKGRFTDKDGMRICDNCGCVFPPGWDGDDLLRIACKQEIAKGDEKGLVDNPYKEPNTLFQIDICLSSPRKLREMIQGVFDEATKAQQALTNQKWVERMDCILKVQQALINHKHQEEIAEIFEGYIEYCKDAPKNTDWEEFLFNTLEHIKEALKERMTDGKL